MTFQKLSEAIGRAVIVLVVVSFLCSVTEELVSIRNELFDLRRMLLAAGIRSADAPKHKQAPSASEEATVQTHGETA